MNHPCACGDYASITLMLKSFLGSPPRLRGLLKALYCPLLCARITPALAGTTKSIQDT